MPTVTGFPQSSSPVGLCRLMVALLALVFLSACAPASQSDAELRQEIKALKAQVAALQEKLNQVQTGQQAILDRLKHPAPVAAPMAAPPAPMVMPSQPAAPAVLTVAELIASKDRYLGTRVKVKGMPGPVMVHHKSLMLKGTQGMIEVLFGNIPDPKLVQTLSSTALDKPLTVTGVVNLPPARGAGAQLQINAEAVEF
jgi:hypothetical protein